MRQYTLPQLNCNTAATLNPSQHSVNPSLGLEPPLTRFGRLSVAFSIFVRFGRVGTPLNFRQCESRMLHPAFMCNDIFILFTLTNTKMHTHTGTHARSHTQILCADMLQNGKHFLALREKFLSTHFVAICTNSKTKNRGRRLRRRWETRLFLIKTTLRQRKSLKKS